MDRPVDIASTGAAAARGRRAGLGRCSVRCRGPPQPTNRRTVVRGRPRAVDRTLAIERPDTAARADAGPDAAARRRRPIPRRPRRPTATPDTRGRPRRRTRPRRRPRRPTARRTPTPAAAAHHDEPQPVPPLRDGPPVHELLVRAGRRPVDGQPGPPARATRAFARQERTSTRRPGLHNRYQYATRGNDPQGWAWALRYFTARPRYYARAYTYKTAGARSHRRRRSPAPGIPVGVTVNARDARLGRPRLPRRRSTRPSRRRRRSSGSTSAARSGSPRIRGRTTT